MAVADKAGLKWPTRRSVNQADLCDLLLFPYGVLAKRDEVFLHLICMRLAFAAGQPMRRTLARNGS